MRWIVKLTNGGGLLRYWDGEASSEVGAVAKALDANPNHWVLRSWPVSDSEYAAIIGDKTHKVIEGDDDV